MILIGELSLWVALLMAAWSTTVSYAGGATRRADLTDSGVRGLYATFAMIVLASVGLWTALLTKDFSLEYVAGHISSTMPSVYIFTSFWSGQAGSMLFWALILSMYGTIAISTSRRGNAELIPWATGTISAVLLFFIGTTCLKANPFTRLDFTPMDGRGMNPQLQNPGMAIHPPNLYLGYVATAIPFAFAIAALFTRRLDAQWLGIVRRWTLLSWFFLTIGIVLGMWWAYVELGWGGYWAWDPVENSSFLPWLTNTAFLHSIMVQEKRGMLRKWNVVLVVMSFLLAIFGTTLTRSGVIESVHSFAQSPVGPWFLTFFGVATGVTIYLVATRLRDLEAKAELESMVSREAAFLYNNLLLIGIAFAIFWGTVFPVLSEWVTQNKITVGPPFFNSVNVPLGLVLLALTGIGPLIAWRRASLSNLRRQFASPVAAGLVVGALLFALGMRAPYVLVAYTLCRSSSSGRSCRSSTRGDAAPARAFTASLVVAAFTHLVGRNRRRLRRLPSRARWNRDARRGVRRHGVQTRERRHPQDGPSVRDDRSVRTLAKWRFVSQGRCPRPTRATAPGGRTRPSTRIYRRTARRDHQERENRGAIASSQNNPLFRPITAVGIRSTLAQGTPIVLAGLRNAETAELRITLPARWWCVGVDRRVRDDDRRLDRDVACGARTAVARKQGYVAVMPPAGAATGTDTEGIPVGA